VISSPSSNFDLTIEINRGTSNGVGVECLSSPERPGRRRHLGRITHLGCPAGDDPRSQVGVRFGTGDVAVAEGQGDDNPLQLEDVSETSVTHRGAPVVTSGLDIAAYPSGIPVGTVSSVRHTGGSLTSQVLVTPLVNSRFSSM